MTKQVYGIGLNQEFTPLMVRDAIVECFRQAHCMDSGIDPDDEDVNKDYCRTIVQKAFEDSGGDFDQPSKDSIVAAMDNLVDFSKNFRDPSIIQKHRQEIIPLIEKLKDR